MARCHNRLLFLCASFFPHQQPIGEQIRPAAILFWHRALMQAQKWSTLHVSGIPWSECGHTAEATIPTTPGGSLQRVIGTVTVRLTASDHSVQELKAVVEAKEAEKVEVQKQLHELQIQGHSRDAAPREDHEAVQGIIGDMEAHGIGELGCTVS